MNKVKFVVAALMLLLTVEPVLAAGGNWCYGGKKGKGNVINSNMNSAHNCCDGGGKSWTCPHYNFGNQVNCSTNKSVHCP